MDKDKRINRVLAGLSHTGYTTEIERCEARILIEELFQQTKKQKKVIDKIILELANIDGSLSNGQLSDRICNLIEILEEVNWNEEI